MAETLLYKNKFVTKILRKSDPIVLLNNFKEITLSFCCFYLFKKEACFKHLTEWI